MEFMSKTEPPMALALVSGECHMEKQRQHPLISERASGLMFSPWTTVPQQCRWVPLNVALPKIKRGGMSDS